jgi:predicted negative regulator of RcsB-dependent stress response
MERANHFISRALSTMETEDELEANAADQAIIFDHAGDIAHALGDLAEAVNHWTRALELAPEDEGLKDKLYLAPAP